MKKPSFQLPLLLLALLVQAALPARAQQATWQPLFNGKDLSGWQTYLRPSEAAADQQAIGLNRDPHGVFRAENGLLRISGQDWGGIFTTQSFSNYHLRYEVKFGDKKWAPRLHAVADGGLLFHASPPYDHGSQCWMRSIEMQIQETDIGDYHNVGAGTCLLSFSKAFDDQDAVDQYDPAAPLQKTQNRVYRSGNFESAPGHWTTGELVARGADAVFIVNGFVVNRLFNIYREDLQARTTSGQIQFQSEGAEHFLRNIAWRPIPFSTPGLPRLVSPRPHVRVSQQPGQHLEIENKGEAVEIIAVELVGKHLEAFALQLPAFPLVLKKGGRLTIPVAAKPGSKASGPVTFRLETVLGPVKDFALTLEVI